MKKYNKSNIMKRAWVSVRVSKMSLSDALKKAWQFEKYKVACGVSEVMERMQRRYLEKKNRSKVVYPTTTTQKSVSKPQPYHQGCEDYYHGAGSNGRYFGD